MSAPLSSWYSLHDLQSLGVRRAELGGRLEVRDMERLRGLLASDDGAVEAKLAFRRDGEGWLTVRLEIGGDLRLTCQRCLEPFTYAVDEDVELALLESPALESRLPEGYEPIVLEGNRLQPAQLIEDELIVSLPLAPKHARAADCGTLGRGLESEAAPGH